MGLAVKPIECPGGCLGCYEKSIRESGGAPAFDLEKVLAALEKQMALDPENKWNSPTLHGGEPLALPIEAVDAVLKMIFEKYGRSGIQTSGALITPAHVEIFEKYKTCVGVSIDGDTAATNAGRWNAPGFNAAEMTDRTLYGMRLIKDAGVSLSAIVLLRRCNAGTPALRSDLVRFGMRMKTEFGIESMRFNPLIAFDARTEEREALDNAAIADAFRRLAVKAFAENLQWYPVRDFAATLRGESAECAFGECDPWATDAEIPILGDGSLGTCMKVGGGPDGAATLRVEKSHARYEMLPQVRQEAGGCKGCFWWPYCSGGCPGAGIDGDWRNRTRFCKAYKDTFEYISGLPLFPANGKKKAAGVGGHGDKEHGDSNDPKWRAANPWWKGAKK
jgi:uncharacterized protein